MTMVTQFDEDTADRDAAYDYLKRIGLEPTPDAIGQLAGPFSYALQVMCERGYDPDGMTWKSKGWKGLVHDILNKAGRLRYHSWRHDVFDGDSAIDCLNFCGMYWRLRNRGDKW